MADTLLKNTISIFFIFFYLIDKKRCKQYSYSYICVSPHVGAIYHFPPILMKNWL